MLSNLAEMRRIASRDFGSFLSVKNWPGWLRAAISGNRWLTKKKENKSNFLMVHHCWMIVLIFLENNYCSIIKFNHRGGGEKNTLCNSNLKYERSRLDGLHFSKQQQKIRSCAERSYNASFRFLLCSRSTGSRRFDATRRCAQGTAKPFFFLQNLH